MPSRSDRTTDVTFAAGLSALLVVLLFLLEARVDFNWADEGFLWYGSIRALHGELPVRDFEAYEPGRYYWCAGWLALLDQGIVSLRVALAAFQFVGLTLGLLVVNRLVRNRFVLALVGLCLAMWMFPGHKIFESSLALGAMYAAVRVIERPTPPAWLAAGAFVGFVGFMGRNHAVYCSAAFGALFVFLQWKTRAPGLAARVKAGLAGLGLGWLPMLALCLLAPGFFERAWASVETMVWRSLLMTSPAAVFDVPVPVVFNVPIPVPWPWRVDLAGGVLRSVPALGKGALFVLYPVFCVAALARILATRTDQLSTRAPLLASVFVGTTYMHHAFSRPDLQHLAESIHPLLLGSGALLLSFGATRLVTAAWLGLLVVSVAGTLPSRPLGLRLMLRSELVRERVASDWLWLPGDKASHLQQVARVVAAHARPDEAVWLAPHYPGLYPVLGRECPTWDMYPIFPEKPERQRELIRALDRRGVSLVLVAERVLDGREDLRLRSTRPLVWQHLAAEFQEIRPSGLADHSLWRRRTAD